MAEAFELLADHLGPFIDARMAEYFVDEPSWAEAAANRLGRPTEHGATDPLFQLLVVRRFWGPVFSDFYGEDLRKIIGQLIDTRNMWAHFSFPDDPSELQRSVLAIERLLAPVKPEIAGRLRKLRSRVGDAESPETSPTPSEPDPGPQNGAKRKRPPGRPAVSAVKPTPAIDNEPPPSEVPPVEVDVLLTQLTETESVFLELQGRYGDLEEQLHQSRRITETKQLRLSVMEQRLVEVEDRSLSAFEDLKEERVTRRHIEWLIVSLIATVMLFMILATS